MWDTIGSVALAVFQIAVGLGVFGYAIRKAQQINDERLRAVVLWLVHAAEQSWGAGHGEAKKEFVLKELGKRGLPKDEAMVEAAVGQVFPSFPDSGLDADGEGE